MKTFIQLKYNKYTNNMNDKNVDLTLKSLTMYNQ
jgi:hypothetical protein